MEACWWVNIINSKAAREEARLEYQQTALNAFREVSDALITRQRLAEVGEHQADEVKALDTAVSASRDRYNAGRASYYEVLEAQQQLFPTELNLARTERDQLLAVVSLYKALGGGWEAETNESMAAAPDNHQRTRFHAMNETLEFLVRHGTTVVFGAVFIEQLGAPVPAAPWLLAAGALAGAGRMNWLLALVAAASGSLLADLIWFYLGRHYGNRVLGLLCRISLEPDSCARRTQDLYTRYGLPGIVAAKFVPGLGTLAPPLAGNSGLGTLQFIFVDGLACVLHEGCFLLVGVLFSRQLEQVIAALASLGGKALGRGRRNGRALHRLQILPTPPPAARVAHGADHRG